jgi:hypothetical protein
MLELQGLEADPMALEDHGLDPGDDVHRSMVDAPLDSTPIPLATVDAPGEPI